MALTFVLLCACAWRRSGTGGDGERAGGLSMEATNIGEATEAKEGKEKRHNGRAIENQQSGLEETQRRK